MEQKFIKKHLILNYKNNSNKIDKVIQGLFAVYFNEGGLLINREIKAILFFFKKRFKFISKLFIRLQQNYKNTAKAIGVRMGKGKGSLTDKYTIVSKGQIFIEFCFNFNRILILKDSEKKKII